MGKSLIRYALRDRLPCPYCDGTSVLYERQVRRETTQGAVIIVDGVPWYRCEKCTQETMELTSAAEIDDLITTLEQVLAPNQTVRIRLPWFTMIPSAIRVKETPNGYIAVSDELNVVAVGSTLGRALKNFEEAATALMEEYGGPAKDTTVLQVSPSPKELEAAHSWESLFSCGDQIRETTGITREDVARIIAEVREAQGTPEAGDDPAK